MSGKITYANLGANSGHRNMYIRSSDIERGNWESLLMSFPDEALYFMSKGKGIIIVDKSGSRRGKVERIFCPAFSDFIRILIGQPIKNPVLQNHITRAFRAYKGSKAIKKKYDFFKRRMKVVDVSGRTIQAASEPSMWGQV